MRMARKTPCRLRSCARGRLPQYGESAGQGAALRSASGPLARSVFTNPTDSLGPLGPPNDIFVTCSARRLYSTERGAPRIRPLDLIGRKGAPTSPRHELLASAGLDLCRLGRAPPQPGSAPRPSLRIDRRASRRSPGPSAQSVKPSGEPKRRVAMPNSVRLPQVAASSA